MTTAYFPDCFSHSSHSLRFSNSLRTVLSWVLVCWGAFAPVLAVADSKSELVDQVFVQSGLAHVMSQFPELLKAGVESGAKSDNEMASREVVRLKRIIDEAFDVQAISQDLRLRLHELSEDDLQAVLSWYRSPLGEKVLQLEKAANQVSAMEEMNERVLALQKQFRGTVRERLFVRYDKATGATEATVETSLAIQRALVGAFVSGEEGQNDYEQLVKMIDANRFMISGLVGQQVYTSYLYSYASLADEEVEQYIRFAESPSGQRFFALLNNSLREILMAPSKLIGQRIMSDFSDSSPP